MQSSTTLYPDTLPHWREGKWYELRGDGSFYEVPAPSTRPQCTTCGSFGPIIDGRCPTHLSVATMGSLHCVSPEQLGIGVDDTTDGLVK